MQIRLAFGLLDIHQRKNRNRKLRCLTDNTSGIPLNQRIVRALREAIAIILWAFIAIKVIVFDVDVFIFEKYMPSLRWTLNYRFFVLLVLISVVLIGMGRKDFRRFWAYVICYPCILFFWRIPEAILL